MNKIVLVGSTGQVGQELLKTLSTLGELITLTRQELDLTNSDQIAKTIASWQPKIIINASAYTAVDKAESESELAMAINADAPKIMAQIARELSATLVHISTDYVFNGKNHTPYIEEDKPDPIGVYGKSKLLGEMGVKENCDRHIILRTAWVYGARGHGNFVKTMLRLGAAKEELRIVADQIGTPTWSYDIANAIANLLKFPENQIPWGTYHFTNTGVASWYDFAVAIFEEAHKLNFPLKIKTVLPITTAEYPTPAQRPAYSVLSKAKYRKNLGLTPPYWRDSLKKMLAEYYQLSVNN
ncbi:MAG: dTDP-4-dehydrorhamnose reductase [Xenococcus sp. MO_188.B8]|nr:dTDP-4-dehydrorhamnose reductase [Xenococcus sp. MO_188.B8]